MPLLLCALLVLLMPLTSAAGESDDSAPRTSTGETTDGDQAGDPDLREALERFRRLESFTDLVLREYAEPITRRRLWDGAMRGMVAGLDAHSAYLSQRELAAYAPDGSGRAIGFGFDWDHDPIARVVRIKRSVEGGPAYEGGMSAGDHLLGVNGLPLSGAEAQLVIERLLTTPDDSVFTVRHADGTVVEIPLTRRPFTDNGIADSRMLDETRRIGYLRISRFHGHARQQSVSISLDSDESLATTITAIAMRRSVDDLRNRGLRGLVIDLRGNGGGSLTAAIESADAFLSGSERLRTVIVQQVSRHPSRQKTWLARSRGTYPQWPIAVLVDEGTASSAEVLASALRDHKRAILVGSETAGKNTVQQTFLLDEGDALRLTVARYLTPMGRSLENRGLSPDLAVAESDLERFARNRRQRLEASGQPIPLELYDIRDEPLERGREALTAVLLLDQE
jgi:carboxyl-terminal processing protease